MFSVEMKATGPEGFSKAAMALQPSDSVSLPHGDLCTLGSMRRHWLLWPPLHQGGWERVQTGMGQPQQL